MHLSTSNSESTVAAGQLAKSYARAAAATVLAIVLLLLVAEIASRVALVRVSRIEGRIAVDFKAAEAIRPGSKPNVLLIGNSLLLEGLAYDQMRADVGADFNVTRYVIENTGYFDWYYGIRRLLADGSHPDLIILFLNPLNLMDNRIRGEYSAFYMYQARDIPDITKTLGFSMTQASNLVFAHYSFFYASRNNLRNVVLNRSYPAYGTFLHNLPSPPERWPSPEVIRSIAEKRLSALNTECARYQIPFAFVDPPSLKTSGEAELLEAGRLTKTKVSIPIPGGVLKPEMFHDGYHLNQQGAAVFTRALESQVRQWVNDLH